MIGCWGGVGEGEWEGSVGGGVDRGDWGDFLNFMVCIVGVFVCVLCVCIICGFLVWVCGSILCRRENLWIRCFGGMWFVVYLFLGF